MHIQCPHCHNPIELIAAGSLVEVCCPSCGSTFRLEAGDDPGETRSITKGGAGRGEATTAPAPRWGEGPVGGKGDRRTFGRFELLYELGAGAFGKVYKALDPRLDRIVAIKVLRAGDLADEGERDRFL